MKSLKEAQQREADLLAEQKKLAADGNALMAQARKEGRDFNAEEIAAEAKIAAREQEIEAELDQVRQQKVVLERARERELRSGAVAEPNIEVREVVGNPWAKAALEKGGRPGIVIEGRDPFSGSVIKSDMTGFAAFMQAVHMAGIPGGVADPRLVRASVSGMSEGVPSDGGFLLQPEYAAGVLTKMYDIGELLARVEKMPIGPNSNSMRINAIDERSRVDGSRWGGLQSGWLAEGAQVLDGKPKFRQMELSLKKVAALYYATDELLQDATALEAILMRALPEELSFKVEDAIWEGTGAGMPLGILNAPCKVSVSKETGQDAATIVYENVLNMWKRMWARSRPNAVWFINQDTESQLYALSQKIGTAGVPVYLPANGISGQPYSTLFGRPVIPVEYASTLGTEGDIVLADLSQYVLIDKGGVQSAMSIHVRFVYDESTFRFVYRVDGQPMWNVALTPFKGSNTLSPVITLATRS